MKRVILSALLIAVIFAGGCTTNGGNGDIMIVSEGTIIDPAVCMQKGITDRIVVFHSPTCPACLQTIPVLEDIEDNETDREFVFIDLSSEKDKAEELGIMPTHIPTVIINCGVHTGYRSKEDFLELIGD